LAFKENQKQEANLEKVLRAQQTLTATADTEFSLEESVQEALVKSRNAEVKKNQPTYEPNKAF
jgi:hypothetical protein